MRYTVRRLLMVNVAVAATWAWLVYLFDRESAYRIEEKTLMAVAVAIGLPAALSLLAALAFGAGPRRGWAFRTCLALHLGLMTLLCATPLLLMDYDRLAHPAKLSPSRMAFLGMAIGPCAVMTLVYGAGYLLLVFPPGALRRMRAVAPGKGLLPPPGTSTGSQASGVRPSTTSNFAISSPIFESLIGAKSMVTESRALGSRRLR